MKLARALLGVVLAPLLAVAGLHLIAGCSHPERLATHGAAQCGADLQSANPQTPNPAQLILPADLPPSWRRILYDGDKIIDPLQIIGVPAPTPPATMPPAPPAFRITPSRPEDLDEDDFDCEPTIILPRFDDPWPLNSQPSTLNFPQ